MADQTLQLEQLTEALAGLNAAQLRERLDRLEAEAHTLRILHRIAAARERRERRLHALDDVKGGACA